MFKMCFKMKPKYLTRIKFSPEVVGIKSLTQISSCGFNENR